MTSRSDLRSLQPHRLFLLALALFSASAGQKANAEIDTELSGLIYGLGQVNQIVQGAAVIDLGDVHTLKVNDPVALIRSRDGHYTPVGVIRVAESYPTSSYMHKTTGVTPELGDIALFVREFREMKTSAEFRDDFLRNQMVKNSGRNEYSTRGRQETAMAIRNYSREHRKWRQSRRRVIGHLRGASFGEQELGSVDRLLTHLSMMRELYRDGRNSTAAAGPRWKEVTSVLYGPTATSQHEAAQTVVLEDDLGAQPTRVGIREIQREVRSRMFGRLPGEHNLAAFLLASLIEQSPARVETWFQEKIQNSQFPELAKDGATIRQLTRMLRTLQNEI